MTDITPERIAELRQEHVLYPHDPEGPRFCQQCEERWPCTTIALCDALQEARGTASACYGQEMCRGFRDIYEVVARQRDQLRAENERLRAALVVAGVDWRKPPCVVCGYNGPGYYQPETHKCAALAASPVDERS